MTEPTEPIEPRKPTDWEAIGREYRAGQFSVREIARQHGLSEGAIRKRARADNWQRALADKVRKAVRERLVRDDGTQEGARTQRDEEIVETAARRGVELVRQHRATLGRAHSVVQKLLVELEDATDIADTLGDEVESEKDGRRRISMRRAVSLGGRAQTALALGQTLRALVPLERQAFGLDTEVPAGNYVISDQPMSDDEWAARHATGD